MDASVSAHQEDLGDPARAAQDHALVQRLDTAAVHWTRQVGAVVHGKDVGAREDDGACGRVVSGKWLGLG